MASGVTGFLRVVGGWLRLIQLAVLLLQSLPVQALTVTTQSFKVSATVTPGCSMVMGTGGAMGTLNFGSYSGVKSGQVSTQFVPSASLSLACTPGVALSMTIDGGKNFTTVRNMQRSGGTDKVPYRLYSSSSLAANTEILANQAVSVTYSNGDNIALTLYGAAQLTGFSPAGTYSAQLAVTLSW
jgi:spore coat protein U-like protein